MFAVAVKYAFAKSSPSTAAQLRPYSFNLMESLRPPAGCASVDTKLDNMAIELLNRLYPRRAGCALGVDWIFLSDAILACCDILWKYQQNTH